MKSDVINQLVSLTSQFLSCLKLELLKDSQKSAKTLVCKIKVQLKMKSFDDVREDVWNSV